MGSHIFGFWGYESCSYLRLANVSGYLYCTVKSKVLFIQFIKKWVNSFFDDLFNGFIR